jgi:hypothetical protein
MMLGNPVIHGVECPPTSPPTRPSVCWSSSGNLGPTPPIPRQVLVLPTKSDKECPPAPARSRNRKGPGPLPCPIQLDPTFLPYAQKKHPLEFSNVCEVFEPPRKRVKFDVVVVVENAADEEDESSFCFSLVSDSDDEDSPCSSLYSTDIWTHHDDGDGDPVTVPVVVEPPPLRRSARIAAKTSSDNFNSCQVVLERTLPPSARIAASGIRRSSRLAAKARVNYRL